MHRPPSKPHPSLPKQLRIVADYLDGVPTREIGHKFGVQNEYVWALARKCGCPPRQAGFTPENAREHQKAGDLKKRQKRELLDRISAALIANDLIGERLDGWLQEQIDRHQRAPMEDAA